MEQEQPTDGVKGVVQRRVKYREVFNHTSWFSIGVLTPDGRVLEISKSVLDESGLLLEEVIGKPFVELPEWSHSTEAQEQIREAIGRARRGETVRMDIRAYPTREFYRDLDVTMIPFVDSASKAEYLIYTSVDITERKRLEEERRSFIDSIPDLAWMAGPDGSLQYLNERWYTYTQTSPDQVQGDAFSQYIHPCERQKATEQWYAAVRAGVPTEIELRLRNGATGEYRWFLARSVPMKDAQGHIVHRQRLEQVLTNLITNAVKYSPQADRVDISLMRSKSCACIQVRDYGIGIPEAYRDRIFERFNRGVYGTSEQAFPGLGMGLYITNEIVKHYGGDITVESEEGKETTFSVTLPLQ